jgi:hypothetical protein
MGEKHCAAASKMSVRPEDATLSRNMYKISGKREKVVPDKTGFVKRR